MQFFFDASVYFFAFVGYALAAQESFLLPLEAHTVLLNSTDPGHLSLPADPEEKKKSVLELIRLDTIFHLCSMNNNGRLHFPVSRYESDCINELCDFVQFDAWHAIPIGTLQIYPGLLCRAADDAISAGNVLRIRELAGLLHRDFPRLSACFKVDRESMFIYDTQYKYLVGRYIEHLIDASSCYLPRYKELREICDFLDEKEFEQVVKHLLFHNQFKAGLWSYRTLLLQETHPRLVGLQNVIVELEERFERWHKQINESKRSRSVIEPVLSYVYERFMMNLLDKKIWTREDCAVMLEMYRNFYANAEWQADMNGFFNRGLLKLSQYNIKPNAPLFPYDPTDKRTLISELLLDALEVCEGDPHRFDREFREILSQLTESEIDQVVFDIQGLPRFTRIFEKCSLQMILYSSRWGGEKNILGDCLRKLFVAGSTMVQYYKASLRGLCVKKIIETDLPVESVSHCFTPWECGVFHIPFKQASHTYGYAYPSPESPMFFAGTVFEQSESDALSDSALTSSSTSGASHGDAKARRKIKRKKRH